MMLHRALYMSAVHPCKLTCQDTIGLCLLLADTSVQKWPILLENTIEDQGQRWSWQAPAGQEVQRTRQSRRHPEPAAIWEAYFIYFYYIDILRDYEDILTVTVWFKKSKNEENAWNRMEIHGNAWQNEKSPDKDKRLLGQALVSAHHRKCEPCVSNQLGLQVGFLAASARSSMYPPLFLLNFSEALQGDALQKWVVLKSSTQMACSQLQLGSVFITHFTTCQASAELCQNWRKTVRQFLGVDVQARLDHCA